RRRRSSGFTFNLSRNSCIVFSPISLPKLLKVHPVLQLCIGSMIGADDLEGGSVESFFKNLRRIEYGQGFDRPRYQSRPARLMAGTYAGSVVAVKVFVEKYQITPVGIVLKFRGAAENRPPPTLVTKEDVGKPPRDISRHLPQRHHFSGAGRAFDLKIVAVI